MGPVIENKIRKNLRLTPDAKVFFKKYIFNSLNKISCLGNVFLLQSFPRYIEPPVTPVLYFRVFNLTNEEAFLAGRTKNLHFQTLL